jgi:hypothetical protein
MAFVTATMARFHSMGMMAHDDLVCPPPVPACDNPARRLAALSNQPFLLLITCLTARLGFNKFNGLASR